MKRHVLLTACAVAVIFAATATAEAGLFGRLSVVCSPCEPTACQPCEQAVACDPCEPACDPCDTAVCSRPFLPFGGFFLNLQAKLAAVRAYAPCSEVVACDPCGEAAACDPCEPACEPVCRAPFLPFNGFFLNLRARLAAGLHPCTVTDCTPCEPACDPCNPCTK